jgi:hypothetical protein
MVDAVFEPFQEAILAFYRAAPEGSRPQTICAGAQAFNMYKQWRVEHPAPPAWPPGSDDGSQPTSGNAVCGPRYHGLRVELAARPARVSVKGATPHGKPFEYPSP